MDLGISQRIALVTGADSGIGYATAAALLAEGATVALTDQDADRLAAAAADLGRLGHDDGKIVAHVADLTDLAQVHALRDAVVAAAGAPDIVVNAAGIHGAGGDFLDIDDAGWLEALDVDLLAAVRVTRAFLPAMREKGWGRVVFVASEDAVQPYVDELPYCAAKAATLALSKGLSKAYGPEGVLVNAVSPAFVETPMTDEMMSKRADENGTSVDEAVQSFLEEERPGIVHPRRGRPDEVAAVIAFLCSEAASYVTGSNYRVDAGSVATV